MTSQQMPKSLEERLNYLRENIGTRYDGGIDKENPFGLYYVTTASSDNIRRFVDGIGDLNPRYRNEDYARSTKHKCLEAHPLFLVAIVHPGQPLNELKLSSAEARGFHSGTEWEFFRPVLTDDELDYEGINVVEAEIRESRFSGQMVVASNLVEYRNQRKEVVALAKAFVHLSASNKAAREKGKYDEAAKPYRYSEQELKDIQTEQAREEMRGREPRYWEDVTEGEAVGPLVIGPHTQIDWLGYHSVMGFRGSRVLRLLLDSHKVIYDPRINAYIDRIIPHLDHDIAASVGAQGVYDSGAERECLASILFTNWMGDDGFLWKYSMQFRRFVSYGDTCWYRGEITKKYVEDGKHCVEISHWGDNQRGERVELGSATVILPSRENGPVRYPKPYSIEDVCPPKQ